MKKLLLFLLVILVLSGSVQLNAQNPFNKGVNLTGWFQTGSTKSIPFSKYTKQDFQNIKSLGCDVIRLPISLHFMTNGAPDYTIDPLLFTFLDQVVDWAEEVEINLILDNHTIEGANSISVEAPVIRVWPQMAKHFKDRSDFLFYEILNEPHTITTAQWSVIQKKAIDSIRAYDTKHTIIVGGSGYNGISELAKLPVYTDQNLIYTFHFYDPFLFTHQGATWPSPSLGDLGGVPFPYDITRMPECPVSLKGTWIEGSLNTGYKNDGLVSKLKSTLDIAIAFANTRGVKIYCGELGVYNLKSPESDRAIWYTEVCSYLTEKSVPWSMWDYQGGFGLFNKGSNELFEYDLNVTMAEGMGLTPPEQQVYESKPDSVAFEIYSDYAGSGIISGGGSSTGILDFYSDDRFDGDYSVYVTGIPQYTAVDFDFRYNKDLSKLRTLNYALDFWIKGDAAGSNIVARFIDTKTAVPGDHPWRMDYTITASKVPWDGNWHHVNIPLKSFIDIGSWDGAWFSSTNSFDWTAVDRFQFVSENMNFTGRQFWIDNILITDRKDLSIEDEVFSGKMKVNVFPNPASESIHIFSERKIDRITIYDITGREVLSLFPEKEQVYVSLHSFKKACYLIKSKIDNETVVTRLIIN